MENFDDDDDDRNNNVTYTAQICTGHRCDIGCDIRQEYFSLFLKVDSDVSVDY